jgi:hypothetical protein
MIATNSSAPLTGGCACGHVRYRMESAPIIVHGCHCRYCQRMSGSAFGVNAMIEADRVTLLGEGKPQAIHTPSALPAGQMIHRCPRCLVALWSNHSMLGDAIALISAGTLDDGERLSPDVHCFTATKHPWIALPADVPAFAGDYDSAKVWSEEAAARIASAMRR